MIKERDILIWLSHLGNISLEIVYNLKEYFGSLEQFWLSKDKDVYDALYKHRIIADKIIQNKNEQVLLNIIKGVIKDDFRVITILDYEYPKKLLNIYNSPLVLYVKGHQVKQVPMVAVVGSRQAAPYGKWAAYEFSKQLTNWGIGIVSGLAMGIDSEGHKGALDESGYTIAILGCGINKCYPSSNFELMNRIIENGTIISEYPPDTLPLKHHFPARNRIISGLSDAILVMEATEKSGSLITVEHALEQGKEIFSLPGNIDSRNSVGTNKLIRDGARILLSVEDVIEELKIKYPSIRNFEAEKLLEQKLSKTEQTVLRIIREYPMHIDMISYKSKININDLRPILKALELKGFTRQLPGKIFTVDR